MAMNKKKTTTAIVAGVTAVALLLGGTFAWTSISQRALNESAGIVNVGGRLHDDFNGENKDIYVENFTDPLDGGQPIYARIRLDEYMEVGSEAGKYDADSDSYVVDRNAKPVVDGTDIADVSTWTTHVPTESCTVCATSDSCAIHDHWTWTMGNDEAKYFMPTFNKDKDSLDADINGTYHGKDDKDKIYYDDYVEYKENETKKDVAYYDDDTDTEDNNGTRQVEETHTAKLTGTAQVVTMDYWVNTLQGVAGNFWVYDTDGWAYWANPIMPGESTGFLLDGIKMTKNPGEKCYYAINVVAQFATVGDWEYFTDGEKVGLDKDSDALKVMQAAAGNVTTVTVTNNGEAYLKRGETTTFTATVESSAETAMLATDEFTWSVYTDNNRLSDSSSVAVGDDGTVTLTVGEDEWKNTLTVVAKHTSSGAIGASSVVVLDPTLKTTFTMTDDLSVTPYAVLTLNGETATYDGKTSDAYTLYMVRTEDDITSDISAHYINSQPVVKVYNETTTWYNSTQNDVYAWPAWWKDNIQGNPGIGSISKDIRPVFYITNVEIVNKMQPTNTAGWFCAMYNLEDIKGIEKLDTSMVNSMHYMFSTLKLTTLDLSHFDTSKVTNMQGVFDTCTELTKITGIEKWDTSSVTRMTGMFRKCEKLTLDLSGWDVSNVKWTTNGSTYYSQHDMFSENAPGIIEPDWPPKPE